jgi:hypothetical protein
MIPRLLPLICIICGLGNPQSALAHGSVTPDEDLCIIRIGYYRAHFKIYLPRTREHTEYCEDLPESGETVFVMEYEHSGLADVPIDFRVIRNVTGKGVFTLLEDVERINDIDSVTVLHHQAAIQPDVFTVLHNFEEDGEYVGVVTVVNPDNQKEYTAVFPFEVGYAGAGWWPWFVAIAVLIQLNYLWMSGWFSRFRRSADRAESSTAESARVGHA